MANLMLNSKAGGTWWYEILEDKIKIKHPIKKGFNEIPESHMKVLETDHGFKARVANKTYEVLKGGKAKLAAAVDESAADAAKDVDEAKSISKKKIAELKATHADELKKEKDLYKAEYQKLTGLKGEAIRRVKELESERVVLDGQIAQLKAGSNKDSEILKTEIEDLKKENDESLLGLMADHEKKMKSLEGEKGSLEKQVAKLKEDLKKAKAK